MTTRLSVRIDAELARKVKYLRERTRKTTTEVVSASIEAYFEQATQRVRPAELLRDFVASAEGDPDLSATYKVQLGASLSKKTRR
jgi:predicted transcriptional regulator